MQAVAQHRTGLPRARISKRRSGTSVSTVDNRDVALMQIVRLDREQYL